MLQHINMTVDNDLAYEADRLHKRKKDCKENNPTRKKQPRQRQIQNVKKLTLE